MGKPCAVFWDIENIDVPKGQSVASIVNLVRSTIIKPHNLKETFFFCVCDFHKLPANVGHSLTNLDVAIVQAYNGIKDSADIQIMDLMRNFVAAAGQDCTIILLSGDADYYGTLSDLKRLHNASIHLIRLANSFSTKLDQISDYTFMLNNGLLKPVKSTGSSMYFISIKNYPASINVKHVMKELNAQAIGSIEKSAILYDNLICIGFPTLWNAERAIEQLNGSRYHGHFLKVELISNSPLTEIIKCIKPNVTMQTKRNKEVKQLTFIKMSNSNEVDNSKIINLCITCPTKLGSQCILSRKPYLWIVYSFKSDAQDCLPKVQIVYPDAIISEPPIDLTLTCHENPYTVESCELKVSNENRPDSGADNSNIAIVKPERAMQVNKQEPSSSIAPVAAIETKALKESETTTAEPQNSVRAYSLCTVFFTYMYDYFFDTPGRSDEPTKWFLLYKLFEKLYDLGAKKVMFHGNVYCVQFDSFPDFVDACAKMRSSYLEPFEWFSPSLAYRIREVEEQMNRYKQIPWCLTHELDIRCLVLNFPSFLHNDFMQMRRKIFANRECIFIKSVPGKLWIGFPNEIICKKYKTILLKLFTGLPPTNVLMARPSNELLESISFPDLFGDAYDLAFIVK